ncbi:ABC transporter G family member 28-like isoform X3 [Tripterygium wilfordii]|uniref:ABC transporter G family member 28-like isoform X3 n=1 Tax=Tripterygium wilfordii TaxID=458696 RepID=UPI0018F7ED23|nr:ABC transporter G family member 28-like isoform X3 [Tripterygium wilfordii]
MSSRENVNADDRVCFLSVFVLFMIVLSLPRPAACQDGSSYSNNPAAAQIFSELFFKSISNMTSVFKDDIKEQFRFCIEDVDADWDAAFNFSKNTAFLSNCAKKTKGDMSQRLCTAAEIKFYFSSFYERGSKRANYLKPNKNCNLSSWVSGCEPGWACSAGGQKVDLKNSKDMPIRTASCAPCCEGFFCPHGITCMIPCPLGAFCPLAKLNKTTGICDPYHYQLPPGQPNHTCGGADVWADIESSSELFCSAGSYCPSTVQKIPCSSGHFCRTGSISQQSCFRLATCELKSENQNITAYGVLLFAGLSFVLIIIYNCSDQVLATRERRQAKTREKAVQSVRETAQAREKWKSAKDIAKKHAIGLQTQLSRTFSRRKSQRQPDQLRGLAQAKPGSDAALPPNPLGFTGQSSAATKGKKKEKSNLTQMLHEIESDPEGHEGFNLEIGDKNYKKNAPRGKQLHTQSQMFRYAYGQIEREKALQEQNKNLTFSGVISMANDIEIRKRLMVEVAFKDLTLTLKGKNKHLLRCVTGKLMPGRVSAVMGPSGAGKTTFLSALTGKAAGCTMSGMVLVNGKMEPIQSYKRIIGFVPQDDIVHGNLTVEENLWFSARCRLEADLPKPEKVLVVERVIESLGLQPVRDCLVGTIEKRGISGGQRKRVNVGLEMVMEPSLLILDEPTSGLDSSSSQLLLRALRREALEGVNICMVVHQPSYTLFRMFDDLILLAKGGLTVYHGPVKKVEEYFTGLGINVPDRVNPPDYFIDILEGILKPNTSTGVTYKQLPIRWMLHNGYPVPMDMLQSADGLAASASENSAHGGGSVNGGDGQSFAGDFWQDVKCNVEMKKDTLQHNFLKSGDLSDRKVPGVFQQYKYFIGRVGKQRLREARTQAVDYLILLLAGICLGTLAKVSDETFGAVGYTYTVIAVSLLCKIAALRSFSMDKLHYWRESGSGMSSMAYFLSKDTVDHFNTIIKPLVYLSMFYFFNNPRSSVGDNYIVLVCLVYCVTGIAYALALFFEPGPAQLWSVLLPVVLTLIATHTENSKIVENISNLCYTKWALEAFVVSNAKRYSGVWIITRCGSLMTNGYDLSHYSRSLVFLLLTGLASRIVAFIVMVTFQKK